MKHLAFYKSCLNCASTDDVFRYFIKTLNESINLWSYFVNWEKVTENVKTHEINLNILNYILGKPDPKKELLFILKKYPETITTIPILIACRDKKFKILSNLEDKSLKPHEYIFKQKHLPTNKDIEKAVEFAEESGLLTFLKNRKVKNLVDYVCGVEVGLDSNGRKNRGGTQMELIVKNIISRLCHKHNLFYLEQATSNKIRDEWGIFVEVDKSSRRFDFAINKAGTLFIIETNYYSGGGSKLKSTAGEYKSLYDFISKQGHHFIWITDGIGWKNTSLPLRETFEYIPFLLNLKMALNGALEEILVDDFYTG